MYGRRENNYRRAERVRAGQSGMEEWAGRRAEQQGGESDGVRPEEKRQRAPCDNLQTQAASRTESSCEQLLCCWFIIFILI